MEIPKIKLIPSPETNEAKSAVGYKWNETAGTRHFLGGKPEEVSEDDYPTCESCKKEITFFAQIDSVGENYDLADNMVIHNYVCFSCLTVKAQLVQLLA